MEPVVSIVIPNFNKGDLVRRSLDSVLAQTIEKWEAIVVDDASTDGSIDVLREYAERDPRVVVLVNECNRGGCYSRNRGAARARGRYLIFLDSDDALADDCLERRIAEFESRENSGCDMLVFPMGTMKGGQLAGVWRCRDAQNVLIRFLRHEIPWSIMMPIWRSKAFERVGGFDESFPRLQDVELHARALLRGVSYHFSSRETPDCFYYIDEDRMTMNYTVFFGRVVFAIVRFVEKMHRLVDEACQRDGSLKANMGLLHAAVIESEMAAIRLVGDACVSGKIDKKFRNELYGRVLEGKRAASVLRIYAMCYRCGFNRISGFNYLFRKVFRLFANIAGGIK